MSTGAVASWVAPASLVWDTVASAAASVPTSAASPPARSAVLMSRHEHQRHEDEIRLHDSELSTPLTKSRSPSRSVPTPRSYEAARSIVIPIVPMREDNV